MDNIASKIFAQEILENKPLIVEPKSIENNSYLVNNKLIVNSESGNLLNELKKCLIDCERFYFCVAFINFSGLQLLLDTFKDLEDIGVKGKIITSTYLNFTEPKALEKIKTFSNIDLKIFVASKESGLHTKAYIFENKDEYKIIIGSSNITQKALKSNVEWNVKVISKKDTEFTHDVLKEYESLWNCTDIVNDTFLETYKNFIKEIKAIDSRKTVEFDNFKIIKPNAMQVRATENLHRLRLHGENKALVIAATGTGKTYMSAFDVINYKPEKMLFVVHREEILKSAANTFERLCKNKTKTMGLLTGTKKEKGADYLFASTMSLCNSLEEFYPNEFEYLIIDEAHHASSPTYKKILDYFKPKFLLGMTATPERSDSDDVFGIFDNNVALEVRLHEALDLNLVIPFHYFGITDVEGVDLSGVSLDNITEITKRLKVNERVDFIIHKMNFYGHDGDSLKCVGFCASIEHAEFMAVEFNKRGINSVCLTGDDKPSERQKYIDRLQDDEDDLKVIFTVDIFNEGVDIPSINTVLMLRPTDSPIVFIQQLGRGLRKHQDKSFLTVLDFIGNHNKAFLIAIALNGSRFYDKDSLKVAVATEFASVPGCTHIQMDRISQERILQQLNNENFNSMKYLKEEYLEFKRMRNGKVPYSLMDYIKYEGAPDPNKFIKREKTYLGFLAKMEKDEELEGLLYNSDFFKLLKEISSKLPLKRVYEFAIIKYCLNHHSISLEQGRNEILKYLSTVTDEDIIHSFRFLNGDFYDSSQRKSNIKSFNLVDGILHTTEEFRTIVSVDKFRFYIEDVLNYGIVRYEKDFGTDYHGMPFFKLYEQYQMVDAALLSNYTKIHSSFRGSGLITNGNNYFLYIDLHKEEDIKESINYQDKFISRRVFQWQTPNKISQISERGKNIIFNRDRNINLHLFIRKYKEIDGSVEPYIYIGKGNTFDFSGEKPITVHLKLEHEIPQSLYNEFVKKV